MKIFTIFQMKNKKGTIRKAWIFLFWLLIWQIGAMLVHNSILLAGPLEVVEELLGDMQKISFYQTVFMSLLRIMMGFLLGLTMGILFGIAAFFRPFLEEILAPVVSLLKSIPIASFVVLILIWTGSRNLSVFISVLVVFPNVYLHTIMGMKNTDKKLLEMANVFQMSKGKQFNYIYMPAMLPFLISCIEISIGMSFKSGVAAEVIGTPAFSFGEKLYMAKIHLNTAGVFSWTLVVIVVSYGMEKLILYLIRRIKKKQVLFNKARRKTSKRNRKEKAGFLEDSKGVIEIENLSKNYQGKEILKQINIQLEKRRTYCFMGPSGCGKTTFFHILLGIIKEDAGKIKGLKKCEVAAVFQESRLLEDYKAIDNAFLFGELSKGEEWENTEYEELLPKESKDKLAKELSGGMKRRVAILRAMNSEANIIILDEPFSGLDEKMKEITAAYILKKKGSKTLLVSTHNKEDVLLLGGKIIDGDESGFNWNHGGKA